MTDLENYQLVHPELLTEETLLQVLKDRCIEVSKLESCSKAELIETYKRVALPLPQRKYDDSRYLGRKLIGLRISRGQDDAKFLENPAPSSTNRELSLKNNGSSANQREMIVDRLKPPITIGGIESKKIRLSKSSRVSKAANEINKRRNETLEESPSFKKRQKITWP